MKNKFEKNLEKVEKITKEFYDGKVKEKEAKSKLDEANRLLDECRKTIDSSQFNLQRIR